MAEPASGTAGRGWMYLPPVFWAAFAWLFVICLTQVDGATFYALVRGVGAVEYSDAIVIGSHALDFALLAVVTVFVGWVPLSVGGWRWGSDPVRLGSLALMLVGLVTAVVSSSSFAFLPLGLGALLLFAVDARELEDHHAVTLGRSVALTALFGLAVLAVVAVVGDVRWVVGGFDGIQPFSDWTWGSSFVSLQLIAVLDPVLPEITLLMLFGWVLWLLLPRVSKSSWARVSGLSLDQVSAQLGFRSPRRASLVMLGVAVGISAFVGAYPYLPAVNPNSLIIGVDPRYCYSQIMKGLPGIGYPCVGSTSAYYYTHYGVFVLLQGLASLGGSDVAAFELVLPLLAVFLTVSTYFFVSEGTGDVLMAGVAALFASVSLQVVAGVNAGFLGNWLALSFAFLFFAAVLRATRSGSIKYLALACALSVAVLFVHVWTWTLTLGVLGIYLAVNLLEAAVRRELRSKRVEAFVLISLMFAGLAVDAVRAFLPFGSGLETSVDFVLPAVTLANVSLVVQNLHGIFVMYILGGFANGSWYLFGVAGALTLFAVKRDFGRLLGSWLAATAVAFPVFGSLDPDALPARFLYMLPIQAIGAIGFVSLFGVVGSAGWKSRTKKGVVLLFIVALAAVLTVALGFALDNVGFDYRGIPGT